MPRPKKETAKEAPKELVAHGALQPKRSVYDIIGRKEGPYDTDDMDVYEKELAKMNLADMQTHAMNVGVMPLATSSSERLKEVLVRRFAEQTHKYAMGSRTQAKASDPKGAESILSRGR